jgi:hypothetical protein
MGTDTVTCQFGNRSKAFRDNLTFTVTKEDSLRFVEGYRFGLSQSGYVIYSSQKDGLNAKYLHRVMLEIADGDKREGDFIDRNKLNITRDNLRVCTHQQNLCNRGLQSNSTSGLKGAYLDKITGRWCSAIRIYGKKYHLRRHDTAEQAHRLYCFVAKELHGEYACLK